MTHRIAFVFRAIALSFALLVMGATAGQAQIPGPDVPGIEVAVGPQLSTLGFGAGASARFFRSFGASLEYHFTPGLPSIDKTGFNNHVTADVSVHGGTIMATWHPTGGSFAIGAGLMFGGANGDLMMDLDPNGDTTVDLGNGSYSVSDIGVMQGEIDYGGVRPVMAIGLMGSGLNVVLGAAIAEPEADLTVDGPLSTNPLFQQDLDLEIEDIREDLSKVPVYPYIRIGWRFGVL